jgi:hypothetical protein
MKPDLLINATVVDDAIRFVSTRSKDKEKSKHGLKSSSENSNQDELLNV